MSATMSAAVEATAAMESAVTVEAVTAVEPTARSDIATSGITASTPATTSPPASVVAPTVVAAAVVTMAVVSVIPRACADEDSANEPVLPIEPIRRTRVWIVVIVAVGADGSRSVITDRRPNPNADRNLRLGICRGNRQNRKQR